jgi:hypothetical protein
MPPRRYLCAREGPGGTQRRQSAASRRGQVITLRGEGGGGRGAVCCLRAHLCGWLCAQTRLGKSRPARSCCCPRTCRRPCGSPGCTGQAPRTHAALRPRAPPRRPRESAPTSRAGAVTLWEGLRSLPPSCWGGPPSCPLHTGISVVPTTRYVVRLYSCRYSVVEYIELHRLDRTVDPTLFTGYGVQLYEVYSRTAIQLYVQAL